MRKQENLDEFLKSNLEDDSIFEYNNADWLKAEKLIAANASEKRTFFNAKKIVGVLTVAIALVTYFVSNNISNSAKNKTNHLANNKATTKSSNSEVIANKSNKLSANPKLDNSNKGNEKTNVSKTAPLLGSNYNASEIENAANTNALEVKSNVKPIAHIIEKHTQNYTNNRLNEVLDYAQIDTKKHWYEFSKISLFNKNKSNDIFTQNVRNLTIPKELNQLADGNLNTENSNILPEIKLMKPYTFNLFAGIAINKQFAGNYSHNSIPSIDPFVGIEANLYINKKIGFAAQLLYAQRKGLNNGYIISNQYGDSDYVSLSKLFSIEIPLRISYQISKNNVCFIGVAPIFYIANTSTITSATAAPKYGSANGVKKTDAAIVFGYKYQINPKFNIAANANIGLRDVTNNAIFKPGNRDDNVSLRINVGYTLFSRD